MLAYADINLLSMLSRFEPDEAVRVATDSIYVKKMALCKLEGVGAYNPQEVHRDHEIFSTVILSFPLIQEGQLSVSGERMCTILVNGLED